MTEKELEALENKFIDAYNIKRDGIGKVHEFNKEVWRNSFNDIACSLKSYPTDESTFTLPLKKLLNDSVSDVGFVDHTEGGLAFDYTLDGNEYRLILGFTELGMWLEYDGRKDITFDEYIKTEINLTE